MAGFGRCRFAAYLCMAMKILDMHEAQRPREKLLARGAEALSDAELLAILLRSGRKGESALDMAHRLLGLTGGRLTGLFECDSGYLASMPGIGPSRAASLGAAFELGRRFIAEASVRGRPLTNARDIYNLMLPRLKGLQHEECWIILLDDKVREIKSLRIAVGGRKATVIDKSVILRHALDAGASSLILVHNHPNGDPRPTRADIQETGGLRNACVSCSLTFLDHVIVADEHFYSFDEEKMY